MAVTAERVPCYNFLGKKCGYADPGWKWRVVKVYVEYSGRGQRLFYDVVSQSAPKMYRQRLRDKQLSHKVGEHEETADAEPGTVA